MVSNLVLLLLALANPVNPVIERAAANAQALWDQLQALQCTERIRQNRLDDSGKVREHKEAAYDYVLFLKTRRASLLVDESRVLQDNAKPSSEALLKTSGFPTLLFLFHPAFRDRFEFDPPVPASNFGGGIVRIGFRARLEMPAMAALKLQGRTYPIHWQGTAWIDEETGVVMQITADLAEPVEVEGLGIRELRADVRYDQTKLGDPARSVTLPSSALITLATAHQRWQNFHEFSSYRVFSVTTSTLPPESR
jgi:hypothetical protein